MKTKYDFRSVLFSLLFILSSYASATVCIDLSLPESPEYEFQDAGFSITSYDGTVLDANIFVPKSSPGPQGFPTIIFINSWALNDLEYIVPAAEFAKRGYVVLSYSTRGFGCSEGEVQVAHDGDIQDLSSVVDYLQSRPDVDTNNIGVAGISYGSGIGLIGLAKEPRIKTAVAMSTWGSLSESLYGQETARLFWGLLLTLSGELTGNLHPEIREIFLDLLANKNIDFILEWSAERSPLSFVDLINERQAPVFIANNYGDALFPPNGAMALYDRLTGPKRLELNQGTHASGELPGLIGIDNFTWDNTQRWFDYWLKGDTSIDLETEQVSILTDIKQIRESYSDLPNKFTTEQKFYMTPRTWFSDGRLEPSPYDHWFNQSDTIYSGLDSGASTGIPALSALLDGNLGIPVKFNLFWLNRVRGIVYQSAAFDEGIRIRGIPEVTLHISPSSREMQLVAYLYDVDTRGVGTLITHAPISRHDASRNTTIELNMALTATAYDIPAGHRIAIAFDTFDLLYDPPTLFPYSIDFLYSRDFEATLRLPALP